MSRIALSICVLMIILCGAAAMAQEPKAVNPPDDLAKLKAILKDKKPITWVFTGDSVTQGAMHTYGARSYPEHFEERVRWEMQRFHDAVINTGISGDRTSGVLKEFDARTLRFKPDVVSIMFGINDSTAGANGRDGFRANLRKIVELIRAGGAIPILNTPNPLYAESPKAKLRADLPAYVQIIRDVAGEMNVVLVDHYTHWLQAKPAPEAMAAWLGDKALHPGVFGHREMAKEIFRVLDIYSAESPTCNLEVP